MVFLIDLDITGNVYLVTKGVKYIERPTIRPFGEAVPTLTFRADIRCPPVQIPGPANKLVPANETNPGQGEHNPRAEKSASPIDSH